MSTFSPNAALHQPSQIPDDTQTISALWALVEPFTQATLETDADGRGLSDSPSWRAYTGQSVTDWLNDGWLAAVHPDDQRRVLTHWSAAVQQQTPFHIETRLRVPGGWQRTLLRAVPVRHPDEQAAKWIGIARVADAQTQAEARHDAVNERLRQSEDRLKKAMSIETVGVIYFDLVGGIHDANAAFERMSGFRREDFVSGRVRWDQLTPPEFMAATRRSQRELLATWQNTPYQKQYIRPDGSRWWGLFAGKRLSEEECVEFVLDITELVEARQRLEESEARYRQLSADLEGQVQQRTQQLQDTVGDLLRSNQNLEQFAYIASHDLQEPLRKIQSFGELLKANYADQFGEGADLLNRMQDSARRMSNLIHDLLTYSRLSTRRLVTAPVLLTKVVDAALTDLALTVQETEAVLEVGPLPTVPGDKSQLEQLFQNLLSNALKFRHPDVAPQIRIRCQPVAVEALPDFVRPARQAKTYHRIDVEDNGIGFNDRYVDRIFQVFQRLHGKGRYAGTGIGLAICERVVANHGGAITATSQPGKGATFSVYLPA